GGGRVRCISNRDRMRAAGAAKRRDLWPAGRIRFRCFTQSRIRIAAQPPNASICDTTGVALSIEHHRHGTLGVELTSMARAPKLINNRREIMGRNLERFAYLAAALVAIQFGRTAYAQSL